ncbi:phage tail protein [Bacillus sp. FJAT-22090]|uniref:phage tail protein n=1 Tax=Bacillus sp. FJAT-22090 TaxID=1581038 RepID=UPI001C92E415|nr:phage tail protein [Bacillus sp. FJAT-22090]
MPNKTTNFKLIKPLQEEFYDVDVQNSNMDILDNLLKDLHDESAVKNLGFRGLLADVNGIGGPDHIDKYPEGLSAMYTDRTDWSLFLNMTDFSSATDFLFIETNKTIQDGKINATQVITRYKKESSATPVKFVSQYKRVWFSDGTYTGWSNAEKVVFQTEFATHLAERASLTKVGHTQLSSATDSLSEVLSATPKAVKEAYDLASLAASKVVVGSYAGSGGSNFRDMLLGFTPSFVIIYRMFTAENLSQVLFLSPVSSLSIMNKAVSFNTSAMIIANGFRVAGQMYGNDVSGTYTYIAFK